MKGIVSNIYLILLLIVSAICNSCGNSINSFIGGGASLPENPENIVIEWDEGGGMLPEGQTIYISKDSCAYNLWQDQRRQNIEFKITESEMKELYNVFVENEFEDIRLMEEQEVYDRGGTSIRLIVDGEYFDKNNSGMTFLHEDDADAYFNVENAIYNLAMKKIEDQKIQFKISIDQSVVNCPFKLYLGLNQNTLVDAEDSIFNLSYEAEVFPGQNQLDMRLYYKDSNDYYGYPAMFSREYPIIEVSDSINHIRVSYNSKNQMLEIAN